MNRKYKLAQKLEDLLEGETSEDCIDALRIVTTEVYTKAMEEEAELGYNLAGMTTQGNA